MSPELVVFTLNGVRPSKLTLNTVFKMVYFAISSFIFSYINDLIIIWITKSGFKCVKLVQNRGKEGSIIDC